MTLRSSRTANAGPGAVSHDLQIIPRSEAAASRRFDSRSPIERRELLVAPEQVRTRRRELSQCHIFRGYLTRLTPAG